MNFRLPLWFLISSFPLALLAEEEKAKLRFLNQDQLGGNLLSLGKDELLWDSPILEKPVPFLLDQVFDLTLPGKPGGESITASHEATLILMNGDAVRGQLAAVTDEIVEIDTWYAGRLHFNRLMVRDLKIDQRPEYLHRKMDLDEWTPSRKPSPWTSSNSAFIAKGPGGIGREFDLPDEFALTFEAEWRNSLRLHILLFSDDPSKDRPKNGYEIIINRRSLQLRKFNDPHWQGAHLTVPELQENEKANFKIQASAKTGQIRFFVDDRIIEVWNDPNLAPDKLGKAIHFITQDNSPIRLTRIEFSKWDGSIEQMPDPRNRDNMRFGGFPAQEQNASREPDPESEGRMVLRNGDHLKGEVTSISDGFITLKTEFAEVKLPVERLRNISLKPVDLEEPKRNPGDVRAWFADGSSMVFRLENAEAGTLTGYSQTFGTAEFDMDAFSRIEFNIYDPSLPDGPFAEDW